MFDVTKMDEVQSMGSQFYERLAVAIGIVGIICSIIWAYFGGRTVEVYSSLYTSYSGTRYVREWGITIALFLAGTGGTLLTAFVFSGIAEAVDNGEILIQKLKEIKGMLEENAPSKLVDGWTCPRCGNINPKYVGTCQCGMNKPEHGE